MALTEAPLELLPDLRALVAGQRLNDGACGEHQHVYAATGRPTVSIPLGGAAAIDAAVSAAHKAVPRWRGLPASERRTLLGRVGELILADAERLTVLQTLECGMPQQFARALPAAAADFFAYYAGWADKVGGDVIETWPMRGLDYIIDEPYGVVAIIVPWNAPLVSLAQVASAALAAGNTVVLKPSELAPFTALRVGELASDAGLPDGVLNVVPGDATAGEALVRHAGVAKVHFTGSGTTARAVLGAAREHLTPVALELGGKSAHLIFADANVRAAARQALSGLVIYSGQGCANGTRVLVEASVYDEVLELATARLRHVRVGDPLASDTAMGPIVDERSCDRVMGVIRDAREQGQGRLVAGGERLAGELAGGFFIAPTVFADVDNDSHLAQHEIFGPVLTFSRFETDDEAVRMANATQFGLAAYVHTTDLRRAHRAARDLAVGNVWINGFYGVSPSMPFGGAKQSGSGRVGGQAGLREFLRPKNVWLAL